MTQMAIPTSPAYDTDELLERLKVQPKDQYFTAFGLNGRCFYGAPTGYAAAKLPLELLERLATLDVKAVSFASFGSHTDSWFVAYVRPSGEPTYQLGTAVPPALLRFFTAMKAPHLKKSSPFFRVQFGADNSYVAWTKEYWTSENIPISLERFLREISLSLPSRPTAAKGVFRAGQPSSISWHHDGSFFVIGNEAPVDGSSRKYHVWNFASDPVNNGWKELWNLRGDSAASHAQLAQLAHAAINPHTPTCDSYVFIKAIQGGTDPEFDPEFVLRFGPNEPISRVSPPGSMLQVDPRGPQKIELARVNRTGQPHPSDSWELPLQKGETVQIMQDQGRDWFIVKKNNGRMGYAHKTWLDIRHRSNLKLHQIYAQFQEDSGKLFSSGSITSFLDLPNYVNACFADACKLTKKDGNGLGICVHDLEKLLRASGSYSYAFLKEERNKWHPDKFARFCLPDKRDELKKKAEMLFVVMGTLMDGLERAQTDGV